MFGEKHGLTLIELVVVLLLAGVVAFSFLLSVLPVSEALLLVRHHADAAYKSRLAINRISKELALATNVVSGQANRLVYEVAEGSRRTLAWAEGGALTLNEVALSDAVAGFTLQYYADADAAAAANWSAGTPLLELVLEASGGGVLTNWYWLRLP